MTKIANALSPVTRPAELLIKSQPILFSLIILYQGLFSGNAIQIPERLKKLFDSKTFRFFSLMLIALSATQDIEYALLSTLIFIVFMFALKTPEERKKTGLI
jgi:hypothetical protein